MQVYFGTVVRNAPVNAGGELVSLDWDTKRVRAKTPIFPADPDLSHDANPRGNGRGCRGLFVYNGSVVAANYHSLLVFDHGLRLQRTITHGLMAGLHETYSAEGRTLWITSTPLEGALEYDLETGALKRSLWPREIASLQYELNLTPFEIDKETDNRERYLNRKLKDDPSHLHFNAVAGWRDEIYGLLNSFGVIANLSTGEVVIRTDELRGAHNLIINEEGLAFTNDTLGRASMIFDLNTRKLVERIEVLSYPWARSLMRCARISARFQSTLHRVGMAPARPGRELFVRGLALHEDRLFVGMSPASVMEFDWKTKRLVSAYRYSTNVNACVHGLEVVANGSSA